MAPRRRAFLTAEWRYLVMLNYEVDAAVLQPLVPRGTELDLHEGCALASVVGFRFLRTRLLGIAVPFHWDFEEVNLRFYDRRSTNGEVGRGVVFVREIVPRAAIAHPPWHVWTGSAPALAADVTGLYGASFASAPANPPRSSYIAEGSEVTVFQPRRIA